MGEGLEHYDTAKPPMDQVEVVEGDVQKADKWVIPSGQDDQRDHVDHRQRARTVPKVAQCSSFGSTPFNPPNAQCDIHYNDSSQENTLEACWDISKMEPCEMDFSITPPTKERCVK